MTNALISGTNKEEIIKYLKHLNEVEYIKVSGTDKERLIFKNRGEVFDIFGSEDKGVLNPFNDYTYIWLNSFLSNVIDEIERSDFTDFEELEESINNIISEWIDSETDIYTSDLTEWLADNNINQYYLEEVIKEFPSGNNHIALAQYKAIEELYYNALSILINHLKDNFQED